MARKRGLYSLGTAEGLEGATGGLFRGLQFRQQMDQAAASGRLQKARDLIELERARSGTDIVTHDAKGNPVVQHAPGISRESANAAYTLLGLPTPEIPVGATPELPAAGKVVAPHGSEPKTFGRQLFKRADGSIVDSSGRMVTDATTADKINAPVPASSLPKENWIYNRNTGKYEGPNGEISDVPPPGAKPTTPPERGLLDRAGGFISRLMGKGGPAAAPKQIHSQEEYDALPSGSEYLDSQGTRARKP